VCARGAPSSHGALSSPASAHERGRTANVVGARYAPLPGRFAPRAALRRMMGRALRPPCRGARPRSRHMSAVGPPSHRGTALALEAALIPYRSSARAVCSLHAGGEGPVSHTVGGGGGYRRRDALVASAHARGLPRCRLHRAGTIAELSARVPRDRGRAPASELRAGTTRATARADARLASLGANGSSRTTRKTGPGDPCRSASITGRSA
jgi:hypothetical protein